MPDQSKIIDSVNRFLNTTHVNVSLSEEGICSGLVVLYLLAKSAGSENRFFEKNRNLARLRRQDFNDQASLISEFCQKVEVAFNPVRYNPGMQQTHLDKILSLFGQSVKSKFQLGLSADKVKFCEIFNKCIKDDELIYFSARKHAVGLYKKNGKYYLYNPSADKDEDICITTVDKLYDHLRDDFFYKSDDQSNFELEMYVFSNPNLSAAQQPPNTYTNKITLANELFGMRAMTQNESISTALNISLALSSKGNDTQMVEALLQLGANPFATYNKGKDSAFKTACIYGALEVLMQYLNLENQRPTTEQIVEGMELSALHGNSDLLLLLLNTGLQYEDLTHNKDGNTLLHFAAQGYHPHALRILLDACPAYFLSQKNKQGETPLVIAARAGYSQHVKYILEALVIQQKNADIAFLFKEDLIAACKEAAKNGYYQVVRQLLNYLNVKDIGLNLLQIAAENGHELLVKDLLKQNISPTQELLKTILPNCDYNIFRILFNKFDLDRNDRQLNPVYQYDKLFINAVLEGKKIDLSTLLANKVQIHQGNIAGFSIDEVLELAVSTGNAAVIEQLLKHSTIADRLNSVGEKLLVKACRLGYFQCVATLIKYKATIHNAIGQLKELAVNACKTGDLDVIAALMNAGFDPQTIVTVKKEKPDGTVVDEKIPLIMFAKRYNYPDLVATMLSVIEVGKLHPVIFKNLMKFASLKGHLELIKLLMPHAIDANTGKYDDQVYQALERCYQKQYHLLFRYMLDYGVNPQAGSDKDATATYILRSIQQGNMEDLILLLQKTGVALTNDLIVKNDSYSLLEESIKHQQVAMGIYLLQQGIQPADRSKNALHLLTLACESGCVEVVKQLRINLPDTTIAPVKLAELVNKACTTGNIEMLRALIAAGCDIKYPFNRRLLNEGLFLAIQHGQKKMVEELLQQGVNVDITQDNKTLLHYACEQGQKEIVNFLIQNDKIKPENGDSALLQLLYQLYVGKNAPVSDQEKCNVLLRLAYEHGHYAVYEWAFPQLKYLTYLKSGNYPKSGINMTISLLSEASAADTTQKDLPQDEASFSHPPDKNLPANPAQLLNIAYKTGRTDIVIKLLQNGVKIANAKQEAHLVFNRACSNGDLNVVNAMLDKNIDIHGLSASVADTQNKQHTGHNKAKSDLPIKLAAEHGHTKIVTKLVECYKKDNLDEIDLINMASREKHWELLASVLEVTPFTSLTEADIKQLQKYRYEIRDAFIGMLKDSPTIQPVYRDDAKQRLESVLGQNNALGKLLQTPKNHFFFKFTSTEIANTRTKDH